jgi:hypothetical protein
MEELRGVRSVVACFRLDPLLLSFYTTLSASHPACYSSQSPLLAFPQAALCRSYMASGLPTSELLPKWGRMAIPNRNSQGGEHSIP